MTYDVVCLRPEADFLDVGVVPPASLTIAYLHPDDPGLASPMTLARALVIPAVGPNLEPALFDNSRIRLVQVTGAGVDRLDEPTMKRLDIAVANVAGGSNTAVAEYAVGCALTLLRRITWANAESCEGNYVEIRTQMIEASLPGLGELVVGVVGLGTIGTAVADVFLRMGCRIVYYDPVIGDSPASKRIGAQALSLPELLQRADIVTLHLPLVESTENLIGLEELALMKPEAVLINAARGGIVDEEALAARLTSGLLGGAAIDVYADEPPPVNHPLLALNAETARRVLLTPHIAGVTRQAWANLFRSAWENVVRVLEHGEAPLNRVY